MGTIISDRWKEVKSQFTILHGLVRRAHRVVGTLWLGSLAVTLLFDTTEIPGPSIPALLFITLTVTGSYLLLGPWVRGSATVSARLKRLNSWSRTPRVVIRRTHRIAATLFLLLVVVALAITATGGPEPQLVLIPIGIVLLYLAITGLYMFFRPWVTRVRSG